MLELYPLIHRGVAIGLVLMHRRIDGAIERQIASSERVERFALSERGPALILQLVQLIYFVVSVAVIAAVLCRVGTRYTFNANEGWNASWAAIAWSGSQLYPEPGGFTLNNYLPFWFYLTGALGKVTGDNIQAGRLLAGLALLLNAVVISLIVREITGQKRDSWFAGAAFLAICGVLYGNYVAANDPQLAANLVMTIALLFFVRSLDRGGVCAHLVIPLMLLGGLIKHNVVSAPISMMIFLLLYHRPLLLPFVARAAIGLMAVCGVLYVAYGAGLFSAVLFPRQYNLGIALTQTRDQLASYNVLLLVIPYLAFHRGRGAKLIFIYAVVSLVQGFVASGAFDVDVNVFLDLAIAISIGLGLFQSHVRDLVSSHFARLKSALSLAAFSIISLAPIILAMPLGANEARRLVEAMTHPTVQTDLDFLRSANGHVFCDMQSLCYWTGKEFEVDSNNFKMLVFARPALEAAFIDRIKSCYFSLIQLDYNWQDEEEGPFTPKIVEALERSYAETNKTTLSLYMKPACDKAPS